MFSFLSRALRALLVAGAAFAVLPAGSALASTTVGENIGGSPCGSVTSFVVADTNYVVPAGGGTITSFSFASVPGDATDPIDFLVLRPAGGTYTVVGETPTFTLAGTGLETFPANISVRAGDIIGFWSSVPPSKLFNCTQPAVPGSGGFVQADMPTASSDPSRGASIVFTESVNYLDLNESATLVSSRNGNGQGQNGNGQGQNNNNQ